MRLLCASAAMALSMPDEIRSPLAMRGKAGQMSRVSFAGVLDVQ